MGHKVVINSSYGAFHFTEEMFAWMAKEGVERNSCYEYRAVRHNPLLIRCVEECNDVGDLIVVELVGNKYFIDEYDGAESVVEPEDIRWIELK